MTKNKRDTGGYNSPFDPNEIPIGENYFLGIGINSYKHFKHLNNAVKDIKDLAKVLTTQYTFEPTNIDIIYNKKATRRNILKKLYEYQDKVSSKDKLLIYYAGHGYLHPKNKLGYWIPVDAAKGEVADFISNAEIQEIIRTYQAKHVLLISDSCFSASLLMRNAQVKDTSKHWEATNSRYIFTSGKEEVEDGEKGKNSPFAREIIDVLKSNQFEEINIGLLVDQVTKNVGNDHEQKAEATPLFRSGHKGGQFIFYPRENIVGFEKVLHLNNSNLKEAAVEELKKYLLTCQKLPVGYEYSLAIITNQLRKINTIYQKKRISKGEYTNHMSKANQQLKNFLLFIDEFSNIVDTPIDEQKLNIINLIFSDKIYDAINNLLKIDMGSDIILTDTTSIYNWFKEIEKLYNIYKIKTADFCFFYDKYVTSFILLLMRIDIENKTAYPRLWLFNKLLIKSDFKNTFAITREIINYEVNIFIYNDEFFYLLSMLKEKYNNFLQKRVNEQLITEDYIIEQNKIRMFLMSTINDVTSQKHTNVQIILPNDKFSKPELIKKDFRLALNSLSSIQGVENIVNMVNTNDEFEKNWLIKQSKYIENLEMYTYGFYVSIYEAIFSLNKKNLPVVKPELKRKQTLLQIRKSLHDGQIKNAVKSLLNSTISSGLRGQILLLEKDLQQIEEDDFFTDKDKDLIYLRKNRVIQELFKIVNATKKSQKKKSEKKFDPTTAYKLISFETKKALLYLNSYYFSFELNNKIDMAFYLFNSNNSDGYYGIIDKYTEQIRSANIVNMLYKICREIEASDYFK